MLFATQDFDLIDKNLGRDVALVALALSIDNLI